MRLSASTVSSAASCLRLFWFEQIAGFGNGPFDESKVRESAAYIGIPEGPLSTAIAWLRWLEVEPDKRCKTLQREHALAVRLCPATLRGTCVHARLEQYYRGEELDPFRNPIDAIAIEFLPFLPARGTEGIVLEREFFLNSCAPDGEPIQWQGRKDFETEEEVYDHKTTKDFKYSKTVCEEEWAEGEGCENPKCLRCNDLQCLLYTLDSMRRKGAASFPLAWNYGRTRWEPVTHWPETKVIPRRGLVSRARAERVVSAAGATAQIAKRLSVFKSHTEVPPNPSHCKNFGGCSFKGICGPFTAEQEIEAIMNTAPSYPTFPMPNAPATVAAPAAPAFPAFPVQAAAAVAPPPPPPVTWGPHPDPTQVGVMVTSDGKFMRSADGGIFDVEKNLYTPPGAPVAAPAPAVAPVAAVAPAVAPAVAAAPVVATEAAPVKRGPGRPKKVQPTPDTPPPALEALQPATPTGTIPTMRIDTPANGGAPVITTLAGPSVGAAPSVPADATAPLVNDLRERHHLMALHYRAIADLLDGKPGAA